MDEYSSGASSKVLAQATRWGVDYLLAQRAMRELARLLNDGLRPLGISHAQFCLLALLLRDSPPTVGELARDMAMERGHVGAQLSILAHRGLIIRVRCHPEHRSSRLVLSRSGRTVVDEALPMWAKASAEAARKWPQAEIGRLAVLGRVS